MSSLPTMNAGLALIQGSAHVARMMVEIRDGVRPVRADTAAYLTNAISHVAGAVRKHQRPAKLIQAANIWSGAGMESRATTAQEIIDAAVRAGQPVEVLG